MWKKIIYYVGTVVLGILFMMAFFMTQTQNLYQKIVGNSIKSGDYNKILGLYTTFGYNDVVSRVELTDGCVATIYETATIRDITVEEEKYNFLDYEYSVFLSNSKRKEANKQNESTGKNYNLTGFRVTMADNSEFVYYNNGFKDGIILEETDPLYEENSNYYKDYNDLYVDTSSLSLVQYTIPYDLLKDYTIEIKSISIVDASGNDYVKFNFEEALKYESVFFDKVKVLKEKNNDAELNKTTDEFSDFYNNTWKPDFMTLDKEVFALSQSDVFKASFYVKIVIMAIAYIIIILIIGDILVGKKRIISLFKKLTGQIQEKRNSSNKKEVLEAEIVKVKEVKEDSNEQTENKEE